MGTLRLFRTYPAPGSSWRRWPIHVDGEAHGHIGAAGLRAIQVDPGERHIRVTDGEWQSQTLAVTVGHEQVIEMLVGFGVRDADGVGARRLGLSVCSGTADLPRGAIPLHAPGGRTQTFAQGRTKAVLGLSYIGAVDLFLLLSGALIVPLGISDHDPIRVVAGLVALATGAWLLLKVWPGVRLVANQWSWPFEDWRVEAKGDEKNEWRRWEADAPEETH